MQYPHPHLLSHFKNHLGKGLDGQFIYTGFPRMVVPNNHGFPTKNDHIGVFWEYHHLRKHSHEWLNFYGIN